MLFIKVKGETENAGLLRRVEMDKLVVDYEQTGGTQKENMKRTQSLKRKRSKVDEAMKGKGKDMVSVVDLFYYGTATLNIYLHAGEECLVKKMNEGKCLSSDTSVYV